MGQELSFKQRAEMLDRMAKDGVEILVAGGGITGAGVALDAAVRGYRVGLVEKVDFSSGTSSKSTRLVHGGIRYLPQLDFGLVRESLVERGTLLRNAPFLVRRIGFVLPIYADAKRPLGIPNVLPLKIGQRALTRAGLTLYDLMAGRLGLGRHRRIGPKLAAQLVPSLKTDGLVDALLYYDAQTDDARLTTTLVRTAALHGALVANYAEVVGFDQTNGRIVAATVRDQVRDATLTIRVGTVVNAGGVFAGRIEALAGGKARLRIESAKGIHLTLPQSALKMKGEALVLPETEDGRILFIVPSGPRVIVGTTDAVDGDIDHPTASDDEIAYLLRHVNRFISCCLTSGDIISAWAGHRPLLSSRRGDVPSAELSRSHAVVDSPAGMVSIVGGKLTTYRKMAQDVVDHVSRRQGRPVKHLTAHLPLDGAEGWQEARADFEAAAPRYGLQPDTVRHLLSYGANGGAILALLAEDPALSQRIVPDLPYVMAEAVYACRYTMAVKLDDILDRRLHLSTEDWAHGVEVARAVAALMAEELGWDESEARFQVERYSQLYDARDHSSVDSRVRNEWGNS